MSTPPTGAGPSAQAGPDTEKEEGEIEPDPPVQPAASWIKTARSGHRSLMTAEKRSVIIFHQYPSPVQLISNDDRAQLQAKAVYNTSTSKSSTSLKPPGKGRRPILNIKAVPVPDSTPRVFIDGVTYEFNPGGKGLKRTSGAYFLIDIGTIRISLQITSNQTPCSGTLTARSPSWSVSSVSSIDSSPTEISPCRNQSKSISTGFSDLC